MASPKIWRLILKVDGFVLAMLLAIALSFLAPNLGAKNGPLRLDVVTNWGIAAIFFVSGANLSFQALRRGLAAWHLHLFVQITTFVIFPIFGYLVYVLSAGLISEEIRLGFFFLCALPSTISSSVALTAIAKGNVPAAVFNATISNIIGMLITPLLVSIVVTSSDLPKMPLIPAVFAIGKTLLFPFALGQILRPILRNFMEKHNNIIRLIDRAVIISIVFAAFCNANIAQVWRATSAFEIILIGIGVAVLLAIATIAVRFAAQNLGFTRGDQICAVFCASQKSLASGAPIAAILFVGNPALSMIILPIMVYHMMQLILGSIIAKNYASFEMD